MQIFGEEKITIKENNKRIGIILAQIYSIEVKLLMVRFDDNSKTDK